MATSRSFDESLGQGDLADRFRSLWLDQRHVLEEQGYNGDSWKRAAHQIWWAQPRHLREPRTELALAGVLGVNDKTLYRWRQDNPELYVSGGEAAKRLIGEWLPDVMWAAIHNAIHGAEKGASDRRLLAEIGGLKPQTGVDVTSGGQPLKTYSVLAHPDMWDEEPETPPPAE